jgi:hypothetical protein
MGHVADDHLLSAYAWLRYLGVLNNDTDGVSSWSPEFGMAPFPQQESNEYQNLMRTVAIPDYRSTPGNKGAYALRRIEGDTAHFLRF